jgi:nucleotide-binding universal stress UspA family protein
MIMKKIIAAIDGLKFSESTTGYAVQATKLANAHLVGIFLDDFTYHSYKIYELIDTEGAITEAKRDKLEQKDEKARMQSVAEFEKACRQAGVNYTLHHDRSIAIQELLHESIYADLLVIDSKETLTHYEEKIPTRFIRDLLSNVQCPVLVVPQQFNAIEKVLLLYDGEPSSVYAIKMLSYTFPSISQLPMEVLSVKARKETLHVPDNRLMKEFMKRHFPEAQFTVLKGEPETEIVNYLEEQNSDVLVVLGAYQRGMVSRWFRASMADLLMQGIKVPLFIAHYK